MARKGDVACFCVYESAGKKQAEILGRREGGRFKAAGIVGGATDGMRLPEPFVDLETEFSWEREKSGM
jgi:hypothetical protein